MAGSSVVIDAHAHIVTPSVGSPDTGWTWMGRPVRRSETGRLVLSDPSARPAGFLLTHEGSAEGVEARLAEMDALGVDIQVVSLLPSLWTYESNDRAVDLARGTNDDLASIVAGHPDRFRAFAHLPLGQPDAAVAELERAMTVPGIVGAALGTNLNGIGWDEPALFPVLAAADRLGALLFFHPTAVRFPPPDLRRHHLGNLIGNPSETTLTIAQLIFGGVLERLPGLRTVFAHGGGYAAFAIGRFDHGYRERPEARAAIPHPPSTYLRRMSFDSLVHDDSALRHLIATVGADRVVLGTDYPADMGPADPVAAITGSTALDRARGKRSWARTSRRSSGSGSPPPARNGDRPRPAGPAGS